MESSNLIRLGGLAAVAGGVLWMIGIPGLAEVIPGVSHEGGHLLVSLAGLGFLVVLVVLATRHRGHFSRLGKAGVALSCPGAALIFVGNLLEGGFLIELGWGLFMVGMLLLIVGSIFLGVAAGRANMLPRLGVSLLAIGVLSALMFPFAEATYVGMVIPVLLGLAWVFLGYVLWSERDASVLPPPRAR